MQKLLWVLQHAVVTAMVVGGRQGIHSWGRQCWPHLGGSGLSLGMQRLLGQGDCDQSTAKPRAWGEVMGLMLSPCNISLLGGSYPLPSCSVTEREPKAATPWIPGEGWECPLR